jgi:peptidyl-prolyl cis-trans isomerase A (cyclophilin A)
MLFSLSMMAVIAMTAASCKKENSKVTMETSAGTLTIELYDNESPETVKNFLSYVDSGHYNGTIFHRVISNFMIQGGGFEPGMTEKSMNPPIKNEAKNGLKNLKGTLAMARTQVVDSATAQFFININDNSFLDHGARDFGYCVFGKVIEGMDVVDKIRMVPTGSHGYYTDVPKEDVIIISVKRSQ